MPATTPRPPSSEQVAAFDRNPQTRALGKIEEPLFLERELSNLLTQQIDVSQIAHGVASSDEVIVPSRCPQNEAAECDPGQLAGDDAAHRQKSVTGPSFGREQKATGTPRQ
jgi:hypothetical protein